MDDAEFNRIKEEEKAHLRQMRSLKRAVRLLERQRSVTSALEEMTSRSKAALEANERLIEEMAFDTARHEARLDVAMDDAAPEPVVDPEELARLRARALVEDVRRQEQQNAGGTQSAHNTSTDDKSAPPPAGPESLPEKTLGRMR